MSVEFRSRLQDPVLERLYDYWSAKRSAERLPGRQDIDPVEIGDLLRFLIMADLVEGGSRVRFRLVGTNMVDRWGADFTGRHLDEIMFGSYRDYLQGLFLETARDAMPVFSTGRFRWDVGRAAGTRRLFLPLAGDGHTVDKVLVGQTFTGDVGPPESLKISEARPEQGEIFRAAEAGDAIVGGRPSA